MLLLIAPTSTIE